MEKIEQSAFIKKNAIRAKRASLNDFDRFKVMINRKNKSFKVRQLAKKMGGAAGAGAAKKGAKGAKPVKGKK